MEIIILGVIIYIGYIWFKSKARIENAKRHQNEKFHDMMVDMMSDVQKEQDAFYKKEMDKLKDFSNK